MYQVTKNDKAQRQDQPTAGKWIVEGGELKSIERGGIAALKTWLSRQYDEACMAYGHERQP